MPNKRLEPYDLIFPSDGTEYPGKLRFTIMSNEEQDDFLGSGRFLGSEERALITPQSLPIASITLHMPSALSFADGVSYGEEARGSGLFAGASEAVRQGKGNIEALKSSFSDQLKNFRLTGDAGAMAATRLAGNFGGEVDASVRSVTRLSVNPNFRTLFNNVPIRSFQFQFTFVPKNQDETKEIQRIIKAFRTELYPERIFAKGDFSIGYKFPRSFRIEGFINNKAIPHGFLPSFLTNVNTTYNTDNKSFREDNTFTTYQMDLTFTEVRALSRADVESSGANRAQGVGF